MSPETVKLLIKSRSWINNLYLLTVPMTYATPLLKLLQNMQQKSEKKSKCPTYYSWITVAV